MTLKVGQGYPHTIPNRFFIRVVILAHFIRVITITRLGQTAEGWTDREHYDGNSMTGARTRNLVILAYLILELSR